MSINYYVYISFWNETRFLYVQGKWLIHTCTLDGMPTKLASSSSGEPPIKNLRISPVGLADRGLHVDTITLCTPGEDGRQT
jgi:hypothetical protein